MNSVLWLNSCTALLVIKEARWDVFNECIDQVVIDRCGGDRWDHAAGRRMIGGSAIGGMKETQEMVNFCGEKKIWCTVETLPATECNNAMKRLQKNDVKYRFVLDISPLHSEQVKV